MNEQDHPLVIAVQRLGRGILGLVCVCGPAILLAQIKKEIELELFYSALLAVVVGSCYIFAFSRWRKYRGAFIEAVIIDALITIVFVGFYAWTQGEVSFIPVLLAAVFTFFILEVGRQKGLSGPIFDEILHPRKGKNEKKGELRHKKGPK